MDITVVLGERMRDSDESSDVYFKFTFFLESLNASVEKKRNGNMFFYYLFLISAWISSY